MNSKEKVLGPGIGRILKKISLTVRNWTLFCQNTPKSLLIMYFSRLSGKGPLAVRISDRRGSLHQVVPPNFAVQGAAADL